MKKIFTYFSAALVLAALSTGCNKERSVSEESVVSPVNGVIELTLDATRGADATKTTMSEDATYHALESVWEEDDVVYVFKLDGTYLGSLSIVEGSINNQKTSETAQWTTSYAQFKGTVSEVPAANVRFIYMGEGNSKTTNAEIPEDYTNPCISIPMGTSTSVAGLNRWDFAVATGKIQGATGADNAYCASNFSNRLSFGYFKNEGGKTLSVPYHTSLYYNIATNSFVSTLGVGAMNIPEGNFYMPLVPNEPIDWDLEFTWANNAGIISGEGYKVYPSFTPSTTGAYYRLSGTNPDSYGPVKIQSSGEVVFNTIANANTSFAVSDTKNVQFTEGNLQYVYNGGDSYWRIAPSQFSYFGTSQSKTKDATEVNYLAAGDLELFGWGTIPDSNHGNLFLGIANNSYYSYGLTATAGGQSLTDIADDITAGADWAKLFNNGTKIYAGGIEISGAKAEYPLASGKKYEVLTQPEWTYLFQHQYWAFATVNMTDGSAAKQGIVVFPAGDAFDTEAECQALSCGVSKKVRKLSDSEGCVAYGANKITNAEGHSQVADLVNTYAEFEIDQATIDSKGLLFLPAAGGLRFGFASPTNVGSTGGYWSSTSGGASSAFFVSFNTTSVNSAFSSNRCYGNFVRLAVASE